MVHPFDRSQVILHNALVFLISGVYLFFDNYIGVLNSGR